ncbi:hypothetical protein BCR44DRAFT_1012191 [Catenaria anguillulae PL171]|uniref:Uncharacterized protein n=1 Tax=Catenaria anguillulae PL171 TaxID=765915 RepID=A0A1Y2I847_9FUNG|nr:hypothetical protein BCR44DRAFT_1012191 [Catenaria anguillulae PL171]
MDHGLDPTTALMTYRPYSAIYDCATLNRILFHHGNKNKPVIHWDFERIFVAWATDQWRWRADTTVSARSVCYCGG